MHSYNDSLCLTNKHSRHVMEVHKDHPLVEDVYVCR
jgi:hypothetical protein